MLVSHAWPARHGHVGISDAFPRLRRRCVVFDRLGFRRFSQPWHGQNSYTLAEDIGGLIEKLDRYGLGGGFSPTPARHDVAKLALVGARTPPFMETADRPVGHHRAFFEGIRAGISADRPQFLGILIGTSTVEARDEVFAKES